MEKLNLIEITNAIHLLSVYIKLHPADEWTLLDFNEWLGNQLDSATAERKLLK